MKFLVAQCAEKYVDDQMALDGELVIPNFPTGPTNTFLSISSALPSLYARTAWIPDLSLDKQHAVLCKRYPCLPKSMLETYLIETAVAAAKVEVGTILHVYATYDIMKLAIKDTDTQITLWTKQPTGG